MLSKYNEGTLKDTPRKIRSACGLIRPLWYLGIGGGGKVNHSFPYGFSGVVGGSSSISKRLSSSCGGSVLAVDNLAENYFMSLLILPIRSIASGSCTFSDLCIASRYMTEFHAPYAMMIAALIARNLARLMVAGCTLIVLARHKGQRLKRRAACISSVMSVIYAAKPSSISARSSWQFLQTSDAIE